MSKTKNLGQVAGVFIGKSAPKNTSIIWYDDTPNQMCHKVYDVVTNSWKTLSPDIVSNTTYSELVFNAKKNGLSVGKHYVITDKSNVLAIAITATKVQYPDSLGNILIDDLGSNIQYHVSSSNILIDDLSGVFSTALNKIIFQFQEKDNVDINVDYLFGKARSGNQWVLSKFRFSSLISKDVNNSISWKSGLFFSLKNSLSKIFDKSGGVVSYDSYLKKISEIDINIKNTSKNNQEIIANADKSIAEKTKDSAIYNKKIQSNIDILTSPGDVNKGDTLFTIISKFQRWINKFKFATGISLSKNFTDAKTQQYINNNDTVESAFAKVQYMLKNPTTSGMLPENWTTGAKRDDGGFADPSAYSAFKQDGFPVAGDSIFYAFAKIVDFIQDMSKFGKLSPDWKEIEYKGTIEYPNAGDSIDNAFQKIVAKFRQLGVISNGKLQSVDNKNIFDILNGSLKFSDSEDSYSLLNSSFLCLENDRDEMLCSSDYISLKRNGKIISRLSSENFQYNCLNSGNIFNGIHSGVIFENEAEDLDENEYLCAFQAYAHRDGSNTYDAYFQRLKIGSISSSLKLVKSDSHYITRQNGIYIYVGEEYGNLYLPYKPDNGQIILICKGGNTDFAVISADGIDFVGESRTNITITKRNVMYAFIYVSGIYYEGSNLNPGMWQCFEWNRLEV